MCTYYDRIEHFIIVHAKGGFTPVIDKKGGDIGDDEDDDDEDDEEEEDGNMQWRKRIQLADRAFAPFSQKTRQWMLCMCVCQPLFIFSIPIINLSKWMNASGTIWDKAGRKKYVVDIFLRFYVSWKYFTMFSEFFFK